MPGVPRATTSRSTSLGEALVLGVDPEDGLAVARARGGARRPGGRSGPGAGGRGRGCRAGWWPPIITMPSVASKPSISDSIWLSVCSRSSWPPPRPAPRLRPMRVDLVHEDDGPAHLAGRLEQVADPAGADADEHLHEVRAGDGQERHARLAGHRPGDEGLARARGADQEDALGDAGADLAEALGVLEEVDDLGDLLLDAVVAGDVGEGRARPLGGVGLGPRAADGHDPAHLALRPTLHPPEEADDQDDREGEGEQAPERVRRRGVVLDLDVVGPQGGQVLGREPALEGPGGGELGAVVELAGDLGVGVVEGHRRDIALTRLLHEGLVGHALAVVAADQRGEQERGEDHPDEDPQRPARPGRRAAGLAVGFVAARRRRRRGRRGLRHPPSVEVRIHDSRVASN